MQRDAHQETQWSPFDPHWYQAAFDAYRSTAEELFNTDFIVQQGFHVPDADGSRNSIFRRQSVLNNTFNESDLRKTLVDIYRNTSHKLMASNHDQTHFYKWYGTMSDFEIIPNTDQCQMVIPTDSWIAHDHRDEYKMRQFYRKWIPIEELIEHRDVFGWCCLVFINQKIYSEYELRMDDHEITIRFRFQPYWYKENMPVSIVKFDTNAQCRISMNRELCEHQWDWKIPLSECSDPRLQNASQCIVAINRMYKDRTDGRTSIDVLGNNLEFLPIQNGCIDLHEISMPNRRYMKSELKQWFWVTILVPKYFHEYPILLSTDAVYRPYESNFQPVVTVQGEFVQHVKADVTEDDSKTVYVDLNEGSKQDGWIQMIRPMVLSDAYDGQHEDPYINALEELHKLRDATVEGADYIESMRLDLSDDNFQSQLDTLMEHLERIHTLHNAYLDRLLIPYNQSYEEQYKSFLQLLPDIRTMGPESRWFHAKENSDHNFWTIISPLIHIPRALVDRYQGVEHTRMALHQHPNVWPEQDAQNSYRYRHPILVEDIWPFEYDLQAGAWYPCQLNIEHHFPDVYLFHDEHRDESGRIFKAFFFYADAIHRDLSEPIRKATPHWDMDVDAYHSHPDGTYQDLFLEKFYWMGVRSIYPGYLLTNCRWEMLEYVIQNPSYERYNELFLKTSDPYFKYGMTTYLKSHHYGFPFDEAVAKMEESLSTEWLGYHKVTNYESYLDHNWKPSYTDSVLKIPDHFEDSLHVVPRPMITFDPIRIRTQLDAFKTSNETNLNPILETLRWVLNEIRTDAHHLPMDAITFFLQELESIHQNTVQAIDAFSKIPFHEMEQMDVQNLLDALRMYMDWIPNLPDRYQELQNQCDASNHCDRKQAWLESFLTISQKLRKQYKTCIETIATFRCAPFMESSNELRTYLDWRKQNPDDNSLLGYVNQFDIAWSNEVKEARNKYFTSSVEFCGMFQTDRPYTQEEIQQFHPKLTETIQLLQSLGTEIREYGRIYDVQIPQTIIDRIEYTEELLQGLLEILNQYLDQWHTLIGYTDEFRSILQLWNDEEDPTICELVWMEGIQTALDQIILEASWIGSDRTKEPTAPVFKALDDQVSDWQDYINEEEQLFQSLDRMFDDTKSFAEHLVQEKLLLKKILEYLQTVQIRKEPESECIGYTHVYECTEVSIEEGGFAHQVADDVYIPNLGVWNILKVDDTSIHAATELIPDIPYKKTFRNPCLQTDSYSTITNGTGSGLFVAPVQVNARTIVRDSVTEITLQKLRNDLKLTKRSLQNPNPYDGPNLKHELSELEEDSVQWKSLCDKYQDHLSTACFEYTDTIFTQLQSAIDLFRAYDEERDKINVGSLIFRGNQYLYQVKSLDLSTNESIYESLDQDLGTLESFCYADGSRWRDADQLQTILTQLVETLQAFRASFDPMYPDIVSLGTTLESELAMNLHQIPVILQKQTDALDRMESIVQILDTFPEKTDDTWYRIQEVRVATSGHDYQLGDVLEIRSEDGKTAYFFRVLQLGPEGVSRVMPLMEYALDTKLWGIYSTTARTGTGSGCTLDLITTPITTQDVLSSIDDPDLDAARQIGENDWVAFRFPNQHDLDVQYEVFLGGKQISDFMQKHEIDGSDLHGTDTIYIHANDLMALRDRTIQIPGRHFLQYRISEVEVVDPGAGYCVGQEVVIEADPHPIRCIVESLRENDPLKGIATLSIAAGNTPVDGFDPAKDDAIVAEDSMSNIDDEYNHGYYDRIPKEGITKPGLLGASEEEYPFISKRFDALENGDRNATFRYPDVDADTSGDPDEGWYLGSRIDNSQVPESDPRVWNGIQNVVDPMHPIIPDACRTPPGQPTRGDYQRIVDVCLHNTGTYFTDPTDKDALPTEELYDLKVPNFASLPKHQQDYPTGTTGKHILVERDEMHGYRPMIYEIRTFVAAGYFVYELPTYADAARNMINVTWCGCDAYRNIPSLKSIYPEISYDAESYRDILHDVVDDVYEAKLFPYQNHTTYIHDMTIDDISVFNWETKQWEDLHDTARWSFHVEPKIGFTLTCLETTPYSMHVSLFLNKRSDVLQRNVPLKRAAHVNLHSTVSQEVNEPTRILNTNLGKELRIRKLMPYQQTETFVCEKGQQEMIFHLRPYPYARNEIHLEDLCIYNKTAGRFEDILDPTLFEVQFKDSESYHRGTETHTVIEKVLIGNAGTEFLDGEAWAYNPEHNIHLFGIVKADIYGDGHITSFEPIDCPNPPDDTTSLQFHVYQRDVQARVHAAELVVHFKKETILLEGDGYIHRVQNRLAPIPETCKIIVRYDLTRLTTYEVRINQTARKWEFVYPDWSNSPTIHLENEWIPKDRLYIQTPDGRMPLKNPANGQEMIQVEYNAHGMDITLMSLYRRYEHLWLHAVPYPMRSVYTQRIVPSSGYIDVNGALNKPLNRRYYEFWMNGKLLSSEVNIISPTKLILHGCTSLKNFEIIEINRDPVEFFSSAFLQVDVDTSGRPRQKWDFRTYLDAALEGTLEKDNYTLEEQESLLTPIWRQVNEEHPEYANYPPNVDQDDDILVVVRPDDHLDLEMGHPLHRFSIVDAPTIEGQTLIGKRLTFEQFGFVPISNQEIVSMLNDEWKVEIADPTNRLKPHVVISKEEWYGMVARFLDASGYEVQDLQSAAYKVFDANLVKVDTKNRTISIVPNPIHYDLE